jgi:transcriptional regulator with XRE-family HTH domain
MDKTMAMERTTAPHPIDVKVGKLIRLRRQELAMSQTDLAKALGLTFQQIQKYEKGTNRVSASRLSEISEALKAPITFFFSETGKPKTRSAEHQEPSDLTEGLRLIKAFGQIEKSKRKSLLTLVESMVPVKRPA